MQILLVAFSRLMCCSRVCSAMRRAGLPLLSIGDADDAARHRALEFIAGGEKSGMRSAIAHRHAEALGGADRDVGAEFARRREKRQRQKIGGQ